MLDDAFLENLEFDKINPENFSSNATTGSNSEEVIRMKTYKNKPTKQRDKIAYLWSFFVYKQKKLLKTMDD